MEAVEAGETVEMEAVDTGEMEAQHTQQLDYLYTQLDSLKQNMRDKQTTLAHVSIAASDSPSHKCTTFTKPIHLLLYRILSAFYVLKLSTNETSSHREQLQEGN